MKYKMIVLILTSAFLCACQNLNAKKGIETYTFAVNKGSVVTPVKYVPVPMPGQFVSKKNQKTERLTGEAAIEAANKKSMKQPSSGEYFNSIMTFNYIPGALYQIYCAPLNVTDIQFQNNEHIMAVAAGDTTRWQVTKAASGMGANRQEHLFVKPNDEELTNGLVVTTDMRTYHLKLHSTNNTSMASVAWNYPDSEGNMLLTNLDDGSSIEGDLANTIDVNRLRFNYTMKSIKGLKHPEWYPRMIFNDGNKTFIKFPSNMQETPSLLIGSGKDNQVINYRVQGDYYVIDSVVYYAQLMGGGEKNQTIIQIFPKK